MNFPQDIEEKIAYITLYLITSIRVSLLFFDLHPICTHFPPFAGKFITKMGKNLTLPIWEYIVFDMRIIATKTINAYRDCYPEADDALRSWVAFIKGNEFEHFPGLKKKFPSADFVPPDRVIFNIKGNHFRLIVAFDFERQVAFVKWFGRHKNYNKIEPLEVQHEYPPC